MEKLGEASATITLTSVPGSSSRARSAALIPASLPPIMTRCMGGFRFYAGLPVRLLAGLTGRRRGRAVAAAFSSSSSPVAPGDRCCAAMPEQITIAARKPLPRNSAASRRHSATGSSGGVLVTAPILTERNISVKIESMNTEQMADVTARAAVHAALADPARLLITDTLAVGDVSPSELAAMLGMPSNLLAHHLHVLEQTGLLTRRRSEGDRRRSYLRLVPGALDSLSRPPSRRARRVLFVCTANSARSHLAAALWRRASKVPAASAGTHPAVAIAPGAKAR